jgi:inner membrane protein
MTHKSPDVYRTGHLGTALLVYAPVGFALLLAGRADLALLGELCMLGLAMVPDYDHRVPFLKHRGVTHTVTFALLVGVVLGTAGWVLGGRPAAATASELAVFGFVVGTLGILAHLVGDVITPSGLKPLWPLRDWHVTLDIARADSTIANFALFALGIFLTATLFVLATGRFPR